MNELQIFNNEMFGEIRMVEIDKIPYAVGNDVAKALEYADPNRAVRDHCRGGVSYPVIDSLGRKQETKVVPEGDIYRLIFKAADQSKNPAIQEKAQKFERWIFDEVIPAIRKHGVYATEELLNNPDLMIKALTALKEEREKTKILSAKVEKDKHKVSYMDNYVEADGCKGIRETAKLFGIKEKEFTQYLVDMHILYRKSGILLPYAVPKNQGMFKVKTGVIDGKIYYQTKFTPHGLLWMSTLFPNNIPNNTMLDVIKQVLPA